MGIEIKKLWLYTCSLICRWRRTGWKRNKWTK